MIYISINRHDLYVQREGEPPPPPLLLFLLLLLLMLLLLNAPETRREGQNGAAGMLRGRRHQ